MRRDRGHLLALGAVGAAAALALADRRGSRNDEDYETGHLELFDIREAAKGHPGLKGWTVGEDWNTKAIHWEPDFTPEMRPTWTFPPRVYASPSFHEEGVISIELGLDDVPDEVFDQEWGLMASEAHADLRPDWTGDKGADVQLYLDAVAQLLQAIDALYAWDGRQAAILLSTLGSWEYKRSPGWVDSADVERVLDLLRHPEPAVRRAVQWLVPRMDGTRFHLRRRRGLGGRYTVTLGPVDLSPQDAGLLTSEVLT